MSFSKVYSAQTALLKAHIIDVEVDLGKGLHSFSVVGLPDKAVEEARDRVSAAIKNSGLKSPKNKNQKVVISLAPADLHKEGPAFDLAIALGYLLAEGDIKFNPEKKLFLGELSLDGALRPITGTLPLIREAKKKGFTEIFLPKENATEAALIPDITIYGAGSLKEVINHLNEKKIEGANINKEETEKIREGLKIAPQKPTVIKIKEKEYSIDFADIKGQETAKRGLLIAASGGHNVAMYGPPGTGKTMLARAFANILPPLSFEEMLEATSIHSVAGALKGKLVYEPPFRSPHHTSSYVSLVGGGAVPKPGEATLAHLGVLFLDEFPEFDRRVIDSLREPLEGKFISVSRARGTASFPANFILIAAMNPCPCGNFGTKGKECICTPINLARYQRKISGPIIDRIDLWTEVGSVNFNQLSAERTGKEEGTKELKVKVLAVRKIQEERFKKTPRIRLNSDMNSKDLNVYAPLDAKTRSLLNASAERLDISARAYHRIIKIARTIADLAQKEKIQAEHILEALQYRPKKQA
jgi:magnesium chelatase family protein